MAGSSPILRRDMAWRPSILSILSPLLLLLLLLPLLPPPPLLLLGTPLTLSTASNLSSEPSAACPSLGGRCGPGEYWSARHCCQCCPPGHHVEEPCSSPHARSVCVACDEGRYMEHANGLWSCRPCTTCREDQEMVRDCTPTRDRQCQCKPGQYYCDSESCPESCHRCTSCPGPTLQTCTATRNTVCAPVAPALPGPAAGSLAVSALVVSVVAFFIVVVFAWWRRGGVPLPQWMCRFTKPALVEPGSHGHTMDPESGPPAPDTETTRLLQEEASALPPGAQTRPGPSADPAPDPDRDPDPDPRAGVELQVEVAGGGQEAPEPAPPTPAAATTGALAWRHPPASILWSRNINACLVKDTP